MTQGNSLDEIKALPQVIGAATDDEISLSKQVLAGVCDEFIVTSTRDAELTKLMSNYYRYAHFAIANQIYMLSKSLDGDPETIPLTVPDIHNPRFSYSGSKIVQDLTARFLLSELAMQTTLVRPHNVYGPNMGYDHVIPEFLLRAKNIAEDSSREFPIQGSGTETRSYCHVKDFCEAFSLILDAALTGSSDSFEIFNIGNDTELDVSSLARKCCKLYGLDDVEIISGPLKSGSSKRRCPDISKARSIGYEPIIDLDAGLLDCKNSDEKL